ncbi:aldose epimerase family protein [Draconibacterium sp. IB214405]|uniref:aldose epimerase family protein n=1 Tax=Draconibacterium sp. IB214405 TaxID=3097352 RepID=UPI002A1529C6|nr:aldose epimerase family protein [Draconibacterium sp. IB214405]MDX8340103.1 aldose epimerase family protein [Draconibacterium sp. IB214405]
MKITAKPFGQLKDGREALLFTLANEEISVKITNYGAIITAIDMPNKNGSIDNIVCGFENLETYLSDDYLGNCPYFGAIIGRFGNRIAKGHLEIEGETYEMAVNNGPNHLHGGLEGFDKKLFDAEIIESAEKVGLKLTYMSADGEENYPGNLKVTCIYTLNANNDLAIQYYAETDKTTVVNLTNHSYFNLTGQKENILNHELELNATKMTEMVEQIPTGKIKPVVGTAFDFTTPKKIGAEGLETGYDDNFVFGNEDGYLIMAGTLSEAKSGRKVEVYTTQPGMQVYTGYWIPEFNIDGKKKFGSYSGVALETQHYPDSVHQAQFPTTILKPGELYDQKTIYKFITE